MSQPRRRWLVVLCLLASVLLAFSVFWLLRPRSAITRENAERIQAGMTEDQVDALLGGPERVEAGDGHRYVRTTHLLEDPAPAFGAWVGDDVAVFVYRDTNGRVVSAEIAPVTYGAADPLARLRRWLRL